MLICIGPGNADPGCQSPGRRRGLLRHRPLSRHSGRDGAVGILFDSEVLQKAFLEFIIGNLPGTAGFIGTTWRKSSAPAAPGDGISLLPPGFGPPGPFFEAITRVVDRAWNIQRIRGPFTSPVSAIWYPWLTCSAAADGPRSPFPRPWKSCKPRTWAFHGILRSSASFRRPGMPAS